MATGRRQGPVSGTQDTIRQFATGAASMAVGGAVGAGNTFADLPGSPAVGARGFITDCASAVFLDVAAGGGANAVPVVFDGTNWLVG